MVFLHSMRPEVRKQFRLWNFERRRVGLFPTVAPHQTPSKGDFQRSSEFLFQFSLAFACFSPRKSGEE